MSDDKNITEVKTVEGDDEINGYIKREWVILSSCTYFSTRDNCVLSAALMGKPWGVEPKKMELGEWEKYAK